MRVLRKWSPKNIVQRSAHSGVCKSRSTSCSRLVGEVSARNASTSSLVGMRPVRSSRARRKNSASVARCVSGTPAASAVFWMQSSIPAQAPGLAVAAALRGMIPPLRRRGIIASTLSVLRVRNFMAAKSLAAVSTGERPPSGPKYVQPPWFGKLPSGDCQSRSSCAVPVPAASKAASSNARRTTGPNRKCPHILRYPR